RGAFMSEYACDAEGIEISFLGGLEALYCLEPKLRKFGFDPQLVASIMDADPDAISELSLQIMEKIISARAIARTGKTHLIRRQLAVPNHLIDWMIACMLEALSWNDHLYIPRELIVLIREQMGASKSGFKRAVQTYQLRWNAIIIGGQLMAQGV